MAEKQENSAENSAANVEVEKTVVERKIRGVVKWFNVKSGYGFVQRLDTKEDLFIHQSSIVVNNPNKARKSVGENENIEFDVAKGPKGLEAVGVSGPDGTPVQGSRYARDIREKRGPRYRNFSQSSNRSGGEQRGYAGGRGGRPPRGGNGPRNGGDGGSRRPPMRRPYMNYAPQFYGGPPPAYMGDQGYPPNPRMMYYRPGPPQNRGYYRPPGPGGYYFRSGPDEHEMNGGYRGGRPRRGGRGGRGGGRGGRSRERTESGNLSASGDQQQEPGRGRRQRSGRRKRKSTNKSESEADKKVDGIASGMERMNMNGQATEVAGTA